MDKMLISHNLKDDTFWNGKEWVTGKKEAKRYILGSEEYFQVLNNVDHAFDVYENWI